MKTKIRDQKEAKRQRLKRKIRSRVSGTADRPRLCVYRSNKNIYAQLIDDVNNVVIAESSDIKEKSGTKAERAEKIGQEIAKKATDKKITKVVFDRNGFNYTGRVQRLADSARKAGLEF
jgi:large subunit ribosomal protein L18